ncbi:MAG: tetratricopeptide repeat protein [Bryobacteraceae bacterium]
MLSPITHPEGQSIEPDALGLILTNQLAQSPRLKLLSSGQIEEIWRRITGNPDRVRAPLSFEPKLAREIALRGGANLLVFGEVGKIADRRVLLIEVELLGQSPSRPRKAWLDKFSIGQQSDVPSVAGEAARWVRRTIGESAAELESHDRPPEDLTTPSWPALQEFVSATVALKAGKQDTALIRLNAALRIDPEFALALARMADILLSSGQFDEGFAYWSKAAKSLASRNLTDRESLRIQGQFALDTGQNQSAEQIFSRYIVEYPNDGLPYFYKASAVERLGRNDEALRLLSLSMQRERAYSFIMGRAVHYLGRGRLSEAERDWKEAAKLRPSDWTDQIRAGLAFARADFAEVERTLEKLRFGGSPEFESRAFALQACLRAEHLDWHAAAVLLQEGLAFDRTMGLAVTARHEKQFLFAQILMARHAASEALSVCEDMLKGSLGYIVRMQFGTLLAQAGQLRQAESCVPKGMPDWPMYNLWLRRLLGEIAFARREYDKALVLFQGAIPPPALRIWPDFVVRSALAAGDYATAGEVLSALFEAPGLYWIEAEKNTPGFVRYALETVRRVNRWPHLKNNLEVFQAIASSRAFP